MLAQACTASIVMRSVQLLFGEKKQLTAATLGDTNHFTVIHVNIVTEGDIDRLGNGDQVGEYSSGDGGGLHASQACDLGKTVRNFRT